MQFLQSRILSICAIFTISLFASQEALAASYGQVVRIQCERTGKYLSYNTTSGTQKIVLSSDTDNYSLWIIKGPLNAPVSGSNPYDRWNCTFGIETATNNYDVRLEHLMTGWDAYFGNYYPAAASAGRVYPYTYHLGQERISDSSAIHYYNTVLNLHGQKKIIVSNELLCEYSTGEAILTQDPVVDTWNIIPVYTMNDSQRSLMGVQLLDSLISGSAPAPATAPAPSHNTNQDVADQLTQDINALIGFYNNEINYSQIIQNAFSSMVNEPDINQRITIVENLASDTANYNSQKNTIFSSIGHTSQSDLIAHINSLLVDNRNVTTDLENELNTINQDLNSVGASSVADLTSKINQLVAALDVLWE